VSLTNNIKGLLKVGKVTATTSEKEYTITFGRHDSAGSTGSSGIGAEQTFVNYGTENTFPWQSPTTETPFHGELVEFTIFDRGLTKFTMAPLLTGPHMTKMYDVQYCKLRYKFVMTKCSGATITAEELVLNVQKSRGLVTIHSAEETA
jgi:hypothetical protein